MNQIIITCLYRVDASEKEVAICKKAFEQVFELYKYKALRMVYSMTSDKQLSEDIVQEVFVLCYTFHK